MCLPITSYILCSYHWLLRVSKGPTRWIVFAVDFSCNCSCPFGSQISGFLLQFAACTLALGCVSSHRLLTLPWYKIYTLMFLRVELLSRSIGQSGWIESEACLCVMHLLSLIKVGCPVVIGSMLVGKYSRVTAVAQVKTHWSGGIEHIFSIFVLRRCGRHLGLHNLTRVSWC